MFQFLEMFKIKKFYKSIAFAFFTVFHSLVVIDIAGFQEIHNC